MESDTVNGIKKDRLRVGFGGAYRTDYPDEKYEPGIQERGGGWNYQLRWKLKPWEEMRSLREDEKGTENGTFYIIIVFSK